MCRGRDAAEQAAETARRTFEEGGSGDALPAVTVEAGSIVIIDALLQLGFAKSKGEARRLVAGGGAKVNGERVDDDTLMICVADEPIRVSAGKKNHGLLFSGQ